MFQCHAKLYDENSLSKIVTFSTIDLVIAMHSMIVSPIIWLSSKKVLFHYLTNVVNPRAINLYRHIVIIVDLFNICESIIIRFRGVIIE